MFANRFPLADRTAGGSIHSDVSPPHFFNPQVRQKNKRNAFIRLSQLGFPSMGTWATETFISISSVPESPGATYRNEERIREILYSQGLISLRGSISQPNTASEC